MIRGLVFTLVLFVWNNSHSQYSEKLFQESVKEFEKGDYKKADSLITASINYERYLKRDYLKYYNRGIFRKSVDSIVLATKDFDTAILLNPNFYPAYENKSICQYLWGDKLSADKTIDSGLKVSPNELEGYILSAIINISIKNYQKSISSCSKALTIKKDPRIFAYRALANIYLKDFDLALKDIESGEQIFGSGSKNILESRIFYFYSVKSMSLCQTVKDHNAIYSSVGSIYLMDLEFMKKYSECIK